MKLNTHHKINIANIARIKPSLRTFISIFEKSINTFFKKTQFKMLISGHRTQKRLLDWMRIVEWIRIS